MVVVADFREDDEHARYAAYCRAVDADEPLEPILDRLAGEHDQIMANGVRIRLIERATSRDGVGALAARPEFGSEVVQRKAHERVAVLDAREATAPDELLEVVATGFKRAHLELLERPDLPADVLDALRRDGATTAIRNRAEHRLRARS